MQQRQIFFQKNTIGVALASLKFKIDKLYVGKLETTPVNLKETRNSSKIRPLDFDKKMIAALRKMVCEIPLNTRATVSAMLLC